MSDALRVAVPDAEEGLVEVVPPPTIAPVSVDELITIEPLPTKDQERTVLQEKEAEKENTSPDTSQSEEQNSEAAAMGEDAAALEQEEGNQQKHVQENDSRN